MNACQQCGACCASYRVDFSVHELDDNGGRVPSGLAVEVNDTPSAAPQEPCQCGAVSRCG